jgi:ferredoxin
MELLQLRLLRVLTFVAILVQVTSFTPSSLPCCSAIVDVSLPENTIDSSSISCRSDRQKTSLNMIFGKKNTGGDNNNNSPTFNGKAVKAKAGDKVSVVASKNRIPITYSCRKGDCGTCEIMMNGMIVKACQAKVLSGKCDMKTF